MTGDDQANGMANGKAAPAPVSDEQLSAWLDGGLDAKESEDMAHLVGRHDALASRAARLRRLDGLVRSVVPGDESIPVELLERLGLAPAPMQPTAEVIQLDVARAAREVKSAAPAPRRSGFLARLDQRTARIAAQLLLVIGVGLGVALLHGRGAETAPEASYRVLGDEAAPAADANAIVQFAPGVLPAQALAEVRDAGAMVVGEPGQGGVARLAIDPARRGDVLARLRASPGVILAEPLDRDRP